MMNTAHPFNENVDSAESIQAGPTANIDVPPQEAPLVSSRSVKAPLIGLGLAAAALSLLTPSSAKAVTPALTFADIPGSGDVKVLNYALALEDLEADLYVQASARLGKGITNAVGKTIPGLRISNKEFDVQYLAEFGEIEKRHAAFLRAAIGRRAIKPFKYDFGFESMSRQQTLSLVFLAEQTGVGAYLGAVTQFSTATYLQTAAAILGTEARHTAVLAAILNELFGERNGVAPQASSPEMGRDTVFMPDDVLAAVSPFIVA